MKTACHVIIQGRPNDDPLGPTGTVGLVQDGTSTILVDAGDPWNGSEIVEKLEEHQVASCQVTHVLVTHGHLDHCANLSMFPEATVIMDWDIGKRGKERAEYSVIPGWPYRISENYFESLRPHRFRYHCYRSRETSTCGVLWRPDRRFSGSSEV
ncbi:unnamed protein product [Caenorhabditis nigoni]